MAFRQVGDECLLVPIRTSPDQQMGIFALNRTAAHVWESLEAPATLEELASKVVARFEVEREVARRDVEGLLGALTERRLVERLEG